MIIVSAQVLFTVHGKKYIAFLAFSNIKYDR
jgi:hypothetical protein